MIQFNDDWRELANGQRCKLLRFIDGDWRVVDFGYTKFTEKYLQRGFIVKPIHSKEDLKNV